MIALGSGLVRRPPPAPAAHDFDGRGVPRRTSCPPGRLSRPGFARHLSRYLLGESECCANRSAEGRGARPGMPSDERVAILPRDTDRHGQTTAELSLPDGRSLNRELVRRGVSWWCKRYALEGRERGRLEAVARQAKRGSWSQPNPIPPWDWRSGKGVPATTGVVGNRSSRLYHSPTCRGVTAMKASNRVQFATAAEVEEAGYRKAGDCR
jgi:hypothetical protein